LNLSLLKQTNLLYLEQLLHSKGNVRVYKIQENNYFIQKLRYENKLFYISFNTYENYITFLHFFASQSIIK